MTLAHVFTAFLVATAFVSWPIVGKYAELSGGWTTALLLFFSAIAGVLFALPAMRAEALPDTKGVMILAVAGLMNGAAAYFYAMKTADPDIATGSFVVIVLVGMILIGTMLSFFLNDEAFTMRKTAGVALAMLSVYLLTGK